jgi:2-polyprenyl-6-methoxyphenol hydroxylase-like FAD-dependent oxidoreductase
MDVLWFRVSRRPTDAESAELSSMPGYFTVALNRRDYWQLAYVIRKGAYEQVRAAGLDAFRDSVGHLLPQLADRASEITDWDQVKLLSVRSDRLRRWYRDGLLCIGDAAHAMSPVGGVGINMAIQDAVEAANMLWRPLRSGIVRESDLARVQRRRQIPVLVTQALQSLVQEQVLRPALAAESRAPAFGGNLRVVARLPVVRDLPARLVGLGVWPPRVRTPAMSPSSSTEHHRAAA